MDPAGGAEPAGGLLGGRLAPAGGRQQRRQQEVRPFRQKTRMIFHDHL